MRQASNRRGTVLIVVLGLITIILGLTLAVTARVYNSIKNGTSVQQNTQAWIMMQAARLVVWKKGKTLTSNRTIGDIDAAALPNHQLDDRQGWARITTASPAIVIACGGSSGEGGHKATALTTITDGSTVRNAMDVRYLYAIEKSTGVTTLKPLPTTGDNYNSSW